MRHLMIALALLAVLGLDVVFIHFSGTATAAVTFAMLGFLILLLFSSTAGSFAAQEGDQDLLPEQVPIMGPGLVDMAGRVLLGACLPVLLMLAVVYIPQLDRSLVPSQAIRLGTTAATFSLLVSLPLAGVVLGFLRPRSGALEAVLVGGVALADYGLLGWATLGMDGDSIRLALFDLMLWPMLALVGAWLGMFLRQVLQAQLDWMSYPAQPQTPAPANLPVAIAPLRPATMAGFTGETPVADCQTYRPGRSGLIGA